jgi:hypothetical protein
VSTSSGIEGKWAALAEERERLKERVEELEAAVAEKEKARREAEALVDADLHAQVTELRAKLFRAAAEAVAFDADEQEVMDHLNGVLRVVLSRWKMKVNTSEVVAAVHVLQGVVAQHMLHRVDPERWSSWWEDNSREGRKQ